MTSYVGQRQLVIGKTLNFAYITPSMELEWVVPYLKRSYSNLVPSFRFSAY
jgi:hypothetical protein